VKNPVLVGKRPSVQASPLVQSELLTSSSCTHQSVRNIPSPQEDSESHEGCCTSPKGDIRDHIVNSGRLLELMQGLPTTLSRPTRQIKNLEDTNTPTKRQRAPQSSQSVGAQPSRGADYRLGRGRTAQSRRS
jgi:hypothetical protein